MASKVKVDTIADSSGSRILASDSGSAWSWGEDAPYALTKIYSSTFSADNDVHVPNVFSSTHRHYKVIIYAGRVSGSTATILRMQLFTTGTTAHTGNDYSSANIGYDDGGSTRTGNSSDEDSWRIDNEAEAASVVEMTIYNPNTSAANTFFSGTCVSGRSADITYISSVIGGNHYTAAHSGTDCATFTGFRIFNSGDVNMTGDVAVYGYQN